jgi:hypothetical protein
MLITTTRRSLSAGSRRSASSIETPQRGVNTMLAATEPPKMPTMKSLSFRTTGRASGSRWKKPRLFV